MQGDHYVWNGIRKKERKKIETIPNKWKCTPNQRTSNLFITCNATVFLVISLCLISKMRIHRFFSLCAIRPRIFYLRFRLATFLVDISSKEALCFPNLVWELPKQTFFYKNNKNKIPWLVQIDKLYARLTWCFDNAFTDAF